MDLLAFCKDITSKQTEQLHDSHSLGQRLVCPEFSKTAQEVKTYPFLSQDRMFALCWNMDHHGVLHTTMCPAPYPFRYSYRFHTEQKTQLHTHDYIELAYVVQGEFHQRILGKEIVFRQGELCLIDKNCLHQDILQCRDAVILFFGISNQMFSEIMNETVSTEKIISFLHTALADQQAVQQYLHFRPSTVIKEIFEDDVCMLLKELYIPQIGSHYICKGLLLRIFRTLSTQFHFSLSEDQKKTMNWIVYEEVCSYIKNHISTITTQQLVDVFHFQEDYFNRLIRKHTGMTYSSYVQNLRLEKALSLIMSTNKTISEIAELVGYHNKGFFYRIFQKKYGKTPKEYRMHRKDGPSFR